MQIDAFLYINSTEVVNKITKRIKTYVFILKTLWSETKATTAKNNNSNKNRESRQKSVQKQCDRINHWQSAKKDLTYLT